MVCRLLSGRSYECSSPFDVFSYLQIDVLLFSQTKPHFMFQRIPSFDIGHRHAAKEGISMFRIVFETNSLAS